MKPLPFIPPIACLAIAAGWLGTQRVAISSLETETAELRERIRLVGSGGVEAGERSLAMRMKEAGEEEGDEIDWEDLAEKLSEANRGGMTDMRAMMELQTLLMEMEADELLAELERIDALDLGKEARQMLDGMLIGMVAQKDPKLVLDRYMDRLHDDHNGMSWQLSNAFQQWQKEEPAAALAWLDAEIAKGTFESKSLDGRSQARIRFESAAIMQLLRTDPEAAAERVTGFPEDQRLAFFNQGVMSFQSPGNQAEFSELVRKVLPEDQWGAAYQQRVGNLMRQGGFEKVDDMISEIEASDGERESIVDHAVTQRVQTLGWEGKLDREKLNEMQEWASSQSPDKADAIMGEALGNVWGDRSKLGDRIKLVEGLHEDGAGDELIVAFLSNQNADAETVAMVGPLVERISDEEKRQEVMSWLEGESNPPSETGVTVEVIETEEIIEAE
ncbi:MAG: hypothetical protein AAGI48_16605 [Verrucomicrobiota bacterium]